MIYNDFRGCENATIKITSSSTTTLDANGQPVFDEVEIYNNSGIYYELSASEQVARDQIQKSATGQVILDPIKVTTQITELMRLYITTTDRINQEFRIVTEKNPLNRDEAIIVDVVEA